jgi:hypothetical protein
MQWIGILGALAGVLLGGVLAMWNERRRWAREDSVKWQIERRNSYRNFLHAVEKYPLGTATQSETPKDETARATMFEALMDIELIGSYRVKALARFIYSVLTGQGKNQTIEKDGSLVQLLTDDPPYDGRDRHELVQTAQFFLIEKAREEFRIEDAGLMARVVQSLYRNGGLLGGKG